MLAPFSALLGTAILFAWLNLNLIELNIVHSEFTLSDVLYNIVHVIAKKYKRPYKIYKLSNLRLLY